MRAVCRGHQKRPRCSCCCQIGGRRKASRTGTHIRAKRAHGVRFGGVDRSSANWRSALARDAACACCTAPQNNNSTAATTSTSLLPAMVSADDALVDASPPKEPIKLALVTLWAGGVRSVRQLVESREVVSSDSGNHDGTSSSHHPRHDRMGQAVALLV